MQVIRRSELNPDLRPDGRTVLPLLDLPVGLSVDRAAILHVVHPADFTEQRHYHQHLYEVFYFLDSADYWVNDTVVRLASGDVLVLEPNDVHGALPVPHPVQLIVYHLPKVPGDKVEVGEGTTAPGSSEGEVRG
jgi:quercetin dioxygenase-like cupin family protein